MTIKQVDISKEELLAMDEVFLTNSLAVIWPVIKIDKKTFASGEVTRQLMSAFNLDEGVSVVGAD
jgi:branched-subunit amino acid aminotransferase/4-amino-4-deoxychorismate lyase